MKYCCDKMDYCVTHKNSLIEYNQSIRSYMFLIYDSEYGNREPFSYCPWCGSKLPKELDEEWGEILEKEYGIEEPGWKQDDELPEEFRTDEWWKKRGL